MAHLKITVKCEHLFIVKLCTKSKRFLYRNNALVGRNVEKSMAALFSQHVQLGFSK